MIYSTDRFVKVIGRKPAGKGAWHFSIDDLEVISLRGGYGACKNYVRKLYPDAQAISLISELERIASFTEYSVEA